MPRARKAQPRPDRTSTDAAHAPAEPSGGPPSGGPSINTGHLSGAGIAIGDGAVAYGAIYNGSQEYEVAGLPNPYLGLRAFGPDEHDIFGGRASLVRALVEQLGAPDGDRLLFVVGASGSGKSSLVRAGLLPELERRLRRDGLEVAVRTIDHPGRNIAVTLPQALAGPLAAREPSPSRVLLLLIDQFEELFTQAEPHDRARALALLADVQARPDLPVRVVATLRSDFLPELLADARFATPERRKVVVREMSVEELAEAILRPIQVRYPERRIEPELVRRLAADAAADASYLPLLQVTLEDLWLGGSLRLAAYHGLADAIKKRADTVYTFRDFDGARQERRTRDEQHEILDIFLSLVRTPLHSGQGDIRWRRPRAEVTRGDPLRERLVKDLASARLLRTDREVWGDGAGAREVETVDLVHEALLDGWPTLRAAIDAKRDVLRQHERFYLALEEWTSHGRRDDYLLTGVRLAEAEAFAQRGDGVLEAAGARTFVERSVQARDAASAAELERERNANIALRRSNIRLVAAFAGAVLLLFVAVGLGSWALRNLDEAREATGLAERQSRIALARALATRAELALAESPPAAALLAVEAMRVTLGAGEPPVSEAEISLRRVVEDLGGLPVPVHPEGITALALSADGRVLAAGDREGVVRVWELGKERYGEADVTLRGHTGAITAIKLSSDGRRLATASVDGIVRVWDVARGTVPLVVLGGHSDGVNALDVSEGFELLVSGGEDGTARVWDLRAADPQRSVLVLRGHKDSIHHVDLSRDTTTLVTVSADYTLRVWRLDEPDPAARSRVLTGLGDWTNDARLSDDGRRLFAGGYDTSIYVWDLTLADPDATRQFWEASSDEHVALSKDGRTLVSGGGDGNVRVWKLDAEDPATARVLRGHEGGVSTIAVSADGRFLVTSAPDKTVRVWELYAGSADTPVRVLRGPEVAISYLALSDDGKTLVTGSGSRWATREFDPNVRVWDLSDLENSVAWERVTELSQGVSAFSPDGALLVSLDTYSLSVDDGEVFDIDVFDIRKRERSEILLPEGDAERGQILRLFPPLISADNSTAVIARTVDVVGPDQAGRTVIHALDLSAEDPAATARPLTGHEGAVLDLEMERNGNFAVVVDQSRAVRVWDLDAEAAAEPARILLEGAGEVSRLALSLDGRTLAAAAGEGIVVWSVEGDDFVVRHRIPAGWASVEALELSADGATLVSGHADGTVRVWDLRSSNPGASARTFEGGGSPLTLVALSADGSAMAAGSADGTIRVWDLGAQEPARSERVLRGHEGAVSALTFSQDAAALASGSADMTVRVWDLRLDDPSNYARILRGHDVGVALVAFGAEPNTLWSRQSHGQLRVWNLDTRGLIAAACALAGRNLTVQEWQRLFGQEPYRRTCTEWPGAVASAEVAPDTHATPVLLPAPRPEPIATAAPGP